VLPRIGMECYLVLAATLLRVQFEPAVGFFSYVRISRNRKQVLLNYG
jgi:hypothetical protein